MDDCFSLILLPYPRLPWHEQVDKEESGSAKSCGKHDHANQGVYGCCRWEKSVGGKASWIMLRKPSLGEKLQPYPLPYSCYVQYIHHA